MQKYCWFVLLLFLTSVGLAQEPLLAKQNKKIIDLISALTEVRRANRMMLKHNGHPLIIQIDQEPGKNQSHYTVSVSEDLREQDHSVTIMRFCVYPKTYAISYYDIVTEKHIPLKQWRAYGSKW
jgi:uncharacterized protein YceH (UPF0502 family)